mmetsp:Transcript_109165/g.307816  ORF Transcript_109165/g.307816 Transcript_109165/m.307816 type:complete len:290 (-) Transcript_109165:1073-1942(-)
MPSFFRKNWPNEAAGDRRSCKTEATVFPSSKSWFGEIRTSSHPGGYSCSAHLRYPRTAGSSASACFPNSRCVSRKSSRVVYFKKNSMVSMCDSNGLRSCGATSWFITNALALDRKASHPSRSTSCKQMSKSAKSKAPNWGHLTTLRRMSSCTSLGCTMARACQARRTWQIRSIDSGSLLLKSIFVSCDSFRTRNTRWLCRVRVAKPLGRCSTSFITSFHMSSTPRHVTSRSRPSLTTASTTYLQSPKRSGNTSSRHFCNSSSSKRASPSSMAACKGGSSRRTCTMSFVT